MFAPKVAKPQTNSGANSSHKLAPQRTGFAEPCGGHEQESSAGRIAAQSHKAAVSWDFSKLPIRPKLEIGAVNDPLEREADQIADAFAKGQPAVGTTAISLRPKTIARKCSECEEEDGVKGDGVKGDGVKGDGVKGDGVKENGVRADGVMENLRRRAGPGAGDATNAGVAPAIVHEVLSSPGRPLDSPVRSLFDRGLGFDFSGVRVHADALAAESARSVGASAYTVGRDVVFNTGRYAPENPEGRRLLAHELVHVMQQSPGTLRRQALPAAAPAPPVPTPLPAAVPAAGPTDFQIDRVGRSTTSKVFFARGSAVVSADAQMQIDSVKTSAPASVRLVGYASADEAPALAQSRADAVKAALNAAPNPVTVSSAVGNAAATASRSDFTNARSVEILVGSAAPTTLDCALKDAKGKLVNPPKRPCPTMDPPTWTAFNTALGIAKDAMAGSVAAVAGAPSAGDAAVIDRFFGGHDAATLATLRTNLGQLNTHVTNLAATTQCGSECDTGGCAESAIAYNEGVGAASHMTLCVPAFKSLASDNDRARNLIHESAHGTAPLGGGPGKGTLDVAYRHERMLFELAPADRLRNSDSYALFALFLREVAKTGNPAAAPAGIATPASDNLIGFSATEMPVLRLALAKLEKRLSWAQDWMGQLYGQIVSIRAGSNTWAKSWAEDLMKQAAGRFPLTAPRATPKLVDQTRVAAIVDRYLRMSVAVKHDLSATRVAGGVVSWGAPASGSSPWLAGLTLEVGPNFFNATAADQISLLLEQIARATKDVEAAFVPAYVSLAGWIHAQNP